MIPLYLVCHADVLGTRFLQLWRKLLVVLWREQRLAAHEQRNLDFGVFTPQGSPPPLLSEARRDPVSVMPLQHRWAQNAPGGTIYTGNSGNHQAGGAAASTI